MQPATATAAGPSKSAPTKPLLGEAVAAETLGGAVAAKTMKPPLGKAVAAVTIEPPLGEAVGA